MRGQRYRPYSEHCHIKVRLWAIDLPCFQWHLLERNFVLAWFCLKWFHTSLFFYKVETFAIREQKGQNTSQNSPLLGKLSTWQTYPMIPGSTVLWKRGSESGGHCCLALHYHLALLMRWIISPGVGVLWLQASVFFWGGKERACRYLPWWSQSLEGDRRSVCDQPCQPLQWAVKGREQG